MSRCFYVAPALVKTKENRNSRETGKEGKKKNSNPKPE